MATHGKYFPNITTAETLLGLPDTRQQLTKSLITIVIGSPPKNPWTDSFKKNPQGLWTGPSSIAYVFFWLSKTHPDLVIERKVPMDWCLAYLDCGLDTHLVAGNGIGVKNEYMVFNTVKVIATNDMACVEKLMDAATAANMEAYTVENEFLSGRAGRLAILRIVRHCVPEASQELNKVMELIIQNRLQHQPWVFQDVAYIGAAHGSIGIITQIVLCDPRYATQLETKLIELLDAQREDGNWKWIWGHGLLKKEPNICHEVTGNALALARPQRDHFMTYATAENIKAGIEDGTYLKGDDRYGLQLGQAGRAWGWMVFDSDAVEEKGWPGYTDI